MIVLRLCRFRKGLFYPLQRNALTFALLVVRLDDGFSFGGECFYGPAALLA